MECRDQTRYAPRTLVGIIGVWLLAERKVISPLNYPNLPTADPDKCYCLWEKDQDSRLVLHTRVGKMM